MSTMPYRTVEANLRAAMRCYARVSEQGEARDYPGLAVTSSGVNCAVFNSALLTEPAGADEFSRRLSLAKLHFHRRKLGWTFWLCEDLVEAAGRKAARAMLRANDMCIIAEPPGMYAEQLLPPRRAPARLEIRPVDDELTRLEFAYLSSQIFALPLETAKAVYGGARLWDGPMRGWLGYFEGQAVSITAAVIGGGATGVYSVGTLPAFQGRGFAETLMRHALDKARREAHTDVTVLQSTTQGMKLYLQMGYRVVTNFVVYLHEGYGAL